MAVLKSLLTVTLQIMLLTPSLPKRCYRFYVKLGLVSSQETEIVVILMANVMQVRYLLLKCNASTLLAFDRTLVHLK